MTLYCLVGKIEICLNSVFIIVAFRRSFMFFIKLVVVLTLSFFQPLGFASSVSEEIQATFHRSFFLVNEKIAQRSSLDARIMIFNNNTLGLDVQVTIPENMGVICWNTETGEKGTSFRVTQLNERIVCELENEEFIKQ